MATARSLGPMQLEDDQEVSSLQVLHHRWPKWLTLLLWFLKDPARGLLRLCKMPPIWWSPVCWVEPMEVWWYQNRGFSHKLGRPCAYPIAVKVDFQLSLVKDHVVHDKVKLTVGIMQGLCAANCSSPFRWPFKISWLANNLQAKACPWLAPSSWATFSFAKAARSTAFSLFPCEPDHLVFDLF